MVVVKDVLMVVVLAQSDLEERMSSPPGGPRPLTSSNRFSADVSMSSSRNRLAESQSSIDFNRVGIQLPQISLPVWQMK